MNGDTYLGKYNQYRWMKQLRSEAPPTEVRVYNMKHELLRVETGKSFEEIIKRRRVP